MDKQNVKKIIVDATAEFNARNFDKKPAVEKVELNDWMRETAETIAHTNWGCSDTGKTKYIEARRAEAKRMKLDVPEFIYKGKLRADDYRSEEISRVAFALVVPTGNPNSHNYPIGKPAMFLRSDDSHCLGVEGFGNNMTLNKDYLRAATGKDIDLFLSKATQKNLDEAFKDIERAQKALLDEQPKPKAKKAVKAKA